MKADISEGGNVKISGESGFYIPAYQRNAFQSLVNKCEGYGFKSGTTAFAQCLQQAEQQLVIENAMRAQQNYQSQQYQQQQFKKAQCYFSGKWDC